jgi:nitrogenase molybdenum-iron protein NifN
MESGYAAAVAAMMEELAPDAQAAGTKPGTRPRQVNVLVSSMLTSGDIEELKEIILAFGLRPVVVPDISDSLDGHLTDKEFNPLTVGGTPVSEFATLGESIATLVVGSSLDKAADILKNKTNVPDYRFSSLVGIEAVDALIMALIEISGNPVPEHIERHRSQLEDAMVDTHFMLGQLRVAIASDPDHLFSFANFVVSMGGEVVAAVTSANAPVLQDVACDEVKIGDLEDLQQMAQQANAQMIFGNSHCSQIGEKLGLPVVRMGFPLYDIIGGHQRTWIGYRGTRQALFDIANLALDNGVHEIKPYRSIYSQRPEDIIARQH